MSIILSTDVTLREVRVNSFMLIASGTVTSTSFVFDVSDRSSPVTSMLTEYLPLCVILTVPDTEIVWASSPSFNVIV